jgi:hypothetical protein
MKGFTQYIQAVLNDQHGVPSTKRIITTLFAILIAIGYLGSLFYGLTVDQKLIDAVMLIVISGFGFTGVEKFAPRKAVTD